MSKTIGLSTQSTTAEDDFGAPSADQESTESTELAKLAELAELTESPKGEGIHLEGIMYLRTLVPITLGSDTSSSGYTSPDPYSAALSKRYASSLPSDEYDLEQEKVPETISIRERSASDPQSYAKTLPIEEYSEDIYLDEEQETSGDDEERVMTLPPLLPVARETAADYDDIPPSSPLNLPPLPFAIAITSTGEGVILVEPPFDSDTYNLAQGDEYTSSQDFIDLMLSGLNEEGG